MKRLLTIIIAAAVMFVLSSQQAEAQFYRPGFGGFGGSGFSLSIGRGVGGFGPGFYGGGFNRGFGNSGFYRPVNSFYRGGFGPSYYGGGGFQSRLWRLLRWRRLSPRMRLLEGYPVLQGQFEPTCLKFAISTAPLFAFGRQ